MRRKPFGVPPYAGYTPHVVIAFAFSERSDAQGVNWRSTGHEKKAP